MSLFNPTSGQGQAYDLIPNGTLANVIVKVREIKNSKEPNATGKCGQYFDLELTVADGPLARRKFFDKIMNPLHEGNTDAGRQMGVVAITRIFESLGFFNPADPATYEQIQDDTPAENIGQAIDGRTVGVKVKIDKGKDGYEDKNVVAEWLSPNPNSGGFKNWQKLQAGDTGAVAGKVGGFVAKAPAAPQQAMFGQHQQAAPTVQQPLIGTAPASGGVPAWLMK